MSDNGVDLVQMLSAARFFDDEEEEEEEDEGWKLLSENGTMSRISLNDRRTL